ncbi:unnamed protein product, partial [Brenthis ino]
MMCELYKILLIVHCTWSACKAQSYFDGSINLAKDELSVWQQYQRNPRVVSTNDQLTCQRPNIFCEEPPDSIPLDSGKDCNFRNVWYHEQVFKWIAGVGCLVYTPDFLYVNGSNPINLNTECMYEGLFVPCLEIVKDDGTCSCYPFDPSFEEVATRIRNALVPSAQGRWESCFYAASDCCSHFMNGYTNDENQCSPTFDGWTCWKAQPNGTTASSVCPEFAYSNTGPTCHHYSSKKCHSNASWELQTDYSTCSVTGRLLARYRFHVAALAASSAASLPAVFIFFFYRRLRVTRVALHRNLLIAIILRNILVMISRSEIHIDELSNTRDTAMSRHSAACRALALAERGAANAVFVCMLVEGVYLHRRIVAVFRHTFSVKWLYGIGAVLGIVPVVAWAATMALVSDHSCWEVYTAPHVQWALDAPRLLVLVVNGALLADVLRVLLTKVRNSENANQLSTAKATLFLMPLFGTQFMFTAIRPRTSDCGWEQAYYFIAYMMEALQGVLVALLYCYINKEVHMLIKATYRKTGDAFTSRMRGSTCPRASVDPNTDRRLTYSTNLHTNVDKHYTTITPKLHVAEIISIQASERLAEILDPVYETIDQGVVNEGYDRLERPDVPNRDKVDEYYGFTNASSVSIGCPDWIQSTPDSVYNSSVNDTADNNDKIRNDNDKLDNDYENVIEEDINVAQDNKYTDETMLDEILQYIDNNKEVQLNPDLLSPNRPDGDKIVFVDK